MELTPSSKSTSQHLMRRGMADDDDAIILSPMAPSRESRRQSVDEQTLQEVATRIPVSDLSSSFHCLQIEHASPSRPDISSDFFSDDESVCSRRSANRRCSYEERSMTSHAPTLVDRKSEAVVDDHTLSQLDAQLERRKSICHPYGLHCPDCGRQFHSEHTLELHRDRECTGFTADEDFEDLFLNPDATQVMEGFIGSLDQVSAFAGLEKTSQHPYAPLLLSNQQSHSHSSHSLASGSFAGKGDWKCQCSRVFASVDLLNAHSYNCLDARPVPPPSPPVPTVAKRKAAEAAAQANPARKLTVPCNVCFAVFDTLGDYERHQVNCGVRPQLRSLPKKPTPAPSPQVRSRPTTRPLQPSATRRERPQPGTRVLLSQMARSTKQTAREERGCQCSCQCEMVERSLSPIRWEETKQQIYDASKYVSSCLPGTASYGSSTNASLADSSLQIKYEQLREKIALTKDKIAAAELHCRPRVSYH